MLKKKRRGKCWNVLNFFDFLAKFPEFCKNFDRAPIWIVRWVRSLADRTFQLRFSHHTRFTLITRHRGAAAPAAGGNPRCSFSHSTVTQSRPSRAIANKDGIAQLSPAQGKRCARNCRWYASLSKGRSLNYLALSEWVCTFWCLDVLLNSSSDVVCAKIFSASITSRRCCMTVQSSTRYIEDSIL